MTFTEALIQLKAFARQDGLWLALLWTASFAAVLLNPQSSWGSLLAIATPFFVGWRLSRFRDGALDGVISFRRSIGYVWYTFFYASLLFAAVQYVYLRFLDHGTFSSLITQSFNMLIEIYKAQGMPIVELKNSMAAFSTLTPIQLTFIFMMQNIFIGILVSFPLALICRRNAPINRNNQQA